MTGAVRSFIDWFFRDRTTGRITIAQFPNLPLWIFLGSFVARAVLSEGTTLHDVASWIGVISLGWWAIDELVRGVNPWRRLLGALGCFLAVRGLLDLLG